jgi:hypothetical protein
VKPNDSPKPGMMLRCLKRMAIRSFASSSAQFSRLQPKQENVRNPLG